MNQERIDNEFIKNIQCSFIEGHRHVKGKMVKKCSLVGGSIEEKFYCNLKWSIINCNETSVKTQSCHFGIDPGNSEERGKQSGPEPY